MSNIFFQPIYHQLLGYLTSLKKILILLMSQSKHVDVNTCILCLLSPCTQEGH